MVYIYILIYTMLFKVKKHESIPLSHHSPGESSWVDHRSDDVSVVFSGEFEGG